MKKVGIMTWYQYLNYGTALQAAALFHTIEHLGYEPTLIQYPPRKAVLPRFSLNMRFLMQKLRCRLYSATYRRYDSEVREAMFASFLQKHMRETPPCRTYPELYELNSVFDAFVCGSDQIWSPNCFDEKYFLSFVRNSRKMIAYAPSIGLLSVADNTVREKMKSLIARFQHLSVRESQGAALIASLCGKSAEVVLDPTLLLDRAQWDTLLDGPKTSSVSLDGGYIVCYFLGDYRRYHRTVRKISKVLHLPVFVIPVFQKQKSRPDAAPFEVGPAEFVNLIRNAAYVCTDSFHGTAFAIDFNIPFTVFKRFRDRDPKNQNSRIYSLLELTGLRHRLAEGKWMNVMKEILECDFTQANRVLRDEREKSLEYLQNALASAVGSESEEKNTRSEFRITQFCCGCGACAAVCPSGAVSVSINADGFEHYAINEKHCVHCGLCRQVCPYCHVSAVPLENAKKLYSFKSSHAEVLKESSSGGVAHEMAQLMNSSGCWVCGSVYLPGKDGAEHLLLSPDDTAKLSSFQGSKYLQSRSADALAQIAAFRGEERLVFFGTPCQTAGVDNILRLRNRRGSALLVDLICHGVPSRLLWEKHLQSIENKYNIPNHPEVRFRSVEGGWREICLKISGSGHTYLKGEKEDDFYAFFCRSLCYMHTCYECPYREHSAADIRIGDYWGPRFTHDRNGVSMVIAVTERGENIVRQLAAEGRGIVAEEELKEYWSVQFPQNPPMPLFYDNLLADLKEDSLSLEKIRAKYAAPFERYEVICQTAGTLKNRIRGQKD